MKNVTEKKKRKSFSTGYNIYFCTRNDELRLQTIVVLQRFMEDVSSSVFCCNTKKKTFAMHFRGSACFLHSTLIFHLLDFPYWRMEIVLGRAVLLERWKYVIHNRSPYRFLYYANTSQAGWLKYLKSFYVHMLSPSIFAEAWHAIFEDLTFSTESTWDFRGNFVV